MGEEPVALEPGDVIVFPHGDAHVMSSDPKLESVPAVPGRYPETVIIGEGGEVAATFVCGFLGCDRRPFNPCCPRCRAGFTCPVSATDGNQSFARQVVEESRAQRAGADSVLTRLAELMFVEVLRRYTETLPPGQRGWLAGLRDEFVGRGLGLLHADPAHPWTIDELAGGVAMSRSAFADRFTAIVGQPPMQYRAQWRMQLAAGRLATGTAKVAAIARRSAMSRRPRSAARSSASWVSRPPHGGGAADSAKQDVRPGSHADPAEVARQMRVARKVRARSGASVPHVLAIDMANLLDSLVIRAVPGADRVAGGTR